jgi:hypothetical protein
MLLLAALAQVERFLTSLEPRNAKVAPWEHTAIKLARPTLSRAFRAMMVGINPIPALRPV